MVAMVNSELGDEPQALTTLIGWLDGLARQEGSGKPFITYKGIKLEF